MNEAHTHAAQVFLSHHDFVKGVALKYAPWPGLMDDIAQQVFLESTAKESKWEPRHRRPPAARQPLFPALPVLSTALTRISHFYQSDTP